MIGTSFLSSPCSARITAVDFSRTGAPDRPPVSLPFGKCSVLLLSNVVLVAITQQLVECVFLLQIAQIFGVGRGDVDGDVAGVRVDAIQCRAVVVGGVFDRRGGIFANIDAKNTAVLDKLAACDVGEQGVYALVIKSHAVDDCLLFGNAKQPRFGVSFLRTRGDGADFDKAKAHGGEYIDVLAIFVQSGSQTDAVGEGQAHQ